MEIRKNNQQPGVSGDDVEHEGVCGVLDGHAVGGAWMDIVVVITSDAVIHGGPRGHRHQTNQSAHEKVSLGEEGQRALERLKRRRVRSRVHVRGFTDKQLKQSRNRVVECSPRLRIPAWASAMVAIF